MNISEIPGQSQLKNQLYSWYKADRIPHAVLLNGQSGYGGLPLAIAFVQFLLCEQKNNFESCLICHNCVKVEKLQHPDLHFSFPIAGTTSQTSDDFMAEFISFFLEQPYGDYFSWLNSLDKGGKQGNISTAECKNIIKKMSLKTMESTLRVMIIWLPEFLGKEGNRLLKLIEEPTDNTLILFVSENLDKILPTILSRVQIVNIPAFESKNLEEILDAQNMTAQKKHEHLILAKGNLHKLLSSLNNDELSFFDDLRQWLNVIFTRKIDLQTTWITTQSTKGRETVKQFLQYTLEIFRGCLESMFLSGEDIHLSEKEKEIVGILLKMKVIPDYIELAMTKIDDAIYAIGRNAQVNLTLHATSIHLQYIMQGYMLEIE